MTETKLLPPASALTSSTLLDTRSQAPPGNALGFEAPSRNHRPSRHVSTAGRQSLQCSMFPGRAREQGNATSQQPAAS